MRYVMILLLPLQLLSSPQLHAQGRRPARPPKPLYDSTQVSLAASPGISHKTAMQAARTYGKIGAHQTLNHEDSVFLRTWSPGYLPEPGTPPARKPNPKR